MPRLPPELARPRCWDLTAGIAGRTPVVHLARAGLLVPVALALAWWLGLAQAWWRGQGVHGLIVIALGLGLFTWWRLLVLPAWRHVSGPVRHLTLSWDPNFPRDELPQATARESSWPWRASADEGPLIPVRVDVVLDWQRWLLLRIVPLASEGRQRAPLRWVVLHDDLEDVGVHRLRLLLHTQATGSTSIPERHAAVASSRVTVGPSVGSPPQSPMKQVFGRLHGAIIRRMATGTSSAHLHRDPVSAFPPTQIDADRRAL